MATKVADAPKRARKPAREAVPETSHPVDIAMIAAASGKPLPDIARRVLEEEARLIRAQCTELRLREVGERVRAVLWAILAVAAFVLVGLIVMVLVKASRADALVVESFRVPPAMAAQGLSGEVVAKEVLDKVAEFQDKTQSARAGSSYDNNWGDDLKIDIPNTGATADQVWKLLRGWLGKETRISGEVIQTKTGLALTARVGSSPGQRFVSNEGDLDSLVEKGAELIFNQTQPYRYAVYLLRTGRRDEGVALLQKLSADPDPRERKWAFIGLGWDLGNQGLPRQGIAMEKQALAIDPNMFNAYTGLASFELGLGHDQAAVDALRHHLSLPIGAEYDPGIAAGSRCQSKFNLGWETRDPALVDEAATCLETAPAGSGSIPLQRAIAQLLRHNWQPGVGFSLPPSPGLAPVEQAENEAEMRLLAETERGPSPALAGALQNYRTAVAAEFADPKLGALYRSQQSTYFVVRELDALVKLGRIPEAQALAATTPLDCYKCLRMRGLIAQAQGDRPAAQRWFAEAARQGPRLAPAFADWGKLLVEARHFDTAEVKLRYAAKLAPNWADPLKYLGDALAGEGKRSEAIDKYDAALKLAPKWDELRQARARLGAS